MYHVKLLQKPLGFFNRFKITGLQELLVIATELLTPLFLDELKIEQI